LSHWRSNWRTEARGDKPVLSLAVRFT
jgi:hypothetical protein